MKPRQLFLGNPGHLGEGEGPAALPLEGVGGMAGGPSPQALPGSTQASHTQCPQLKVIHLHFAFHLETPSATPTKQVPMAPSPAPTLGEAWVTGE